MPLNSHMELLPQGVLSVCAVLLAVSSTLAADASNDVTSGETEATKGVSCLILGERHVKCALATLAVMPCPAGWDIERPKRCVGKGDFEVGLRTGAREFRAAADKALKVAEEPPPKAKVAEKSRPEKKRRMSDAECRLMSRELPRAAAGMADGTLGVDAIRQDIYERLNLPEAGEALANFLVLFRQADLRAFPREMAAKFEQDCRAGKIRAPDRG